MVAKYLYDAWGNCTISSESTNTAVAAANPIRYRGYYYDDDTGLYYCNARYYSPKWRRFISPDDTAYLTPESINGLNLYCYCNNDPVNYCDPSGSSAIVIGLIVGASIGFRTAAYMDYRDDGQIFNGSIAWYDYLGATLTGAAVGAAIGAGIAYCLPAISSFAGSSFSFGGGAAMLLDGSVVVFPGITVTGTKILATTGVLTLGGIMLFASNNRPGNNRAQNKQYEDAARKAGYNPKDPAVRDALQQIHQYIRKNHLNLGWRALVELIKEWLD